MKDEADLFPADKHGRFFQSDTTILGGSGQECSYYPK